MKMFKLFLIGPFISTLGFVLNTAAFIHNYNGLNLWFYYITNVVCSFCLGGAWMLFFFILKTER